MALWGDRDNFANVAVGVATVDLANNTIEIQPGPFAAGVGTDTPIIKLGLGTTCGFAQIVSIASTTTCGIAHTNAIIMNSNYTVAGVAYSLTQMATYLDEDPAAVSQIHHSLVDLAGSSVGISSTRYFGVGSTAMANEYEDFVNGNLGLALTSKFRPAHSGWVGVQTYTDNHGNFRVKTEVLVAMSGIQTGNEPFPNYKA
tara:strand:+ start:555 stop:1154 length:600 start_codon:yes stop_codon:yes gene_type:complete